MRRRPTTEAPTRPPLSRDRVLRAALELADEGGIAALTMRELGRRLDVEAMSLYNHVDTKDDVIDGIVDLVVAEIDVPPDDVGWREAMRRRAVSARETFTRHPWASTLVDTRRSSGPDRLAYLEGMLRTMRRAGFSADEGLRAVSIIDGFTYGFLRQEVGMATGGAGTEESAAAFLRAIPAEEFPNLREVTERVLRDGYDPTGDFDYGLDLILDGLERSRGSRRAEDDLGHDLGVEIVRAVGPGPLGAEQVPARGSAATSG